MKGQREKDMDGPGTGTTAELGAQRKTWRARGWGVGERVAQSRSVNLAWCFEHMTCIWPLLELYLLRWSERTGEDGNLQGTTEHVRGWRQGRNTYTILEDRKRRGEWSLTENWMRLGPRLLPMVGWEEPKNAAQSHLRTPETQALEALGTSDGWEVDWKTGIAAVSPDSFPHTTQPGSALPCLEEYGRSTLQKRWTLGLNS